jgi:UDP-N-acetylglucosamine 2-epimerase
MNEVLVHSGQHYDPELADLFFDELDIPTPDHALEVGPGSPNAQIAHMIARLDPLIEELAPDLVMVYGDTTTTLAGAIAGSSPITLQSFCSCRRASPWTTCVVRGSPRGSTWSAT